ncbi:MAG: helix-turn-helix transcriptional regulator, partial [Hyphomicrobiales bacterium]|nr:helix-turn-helix transcriptional regulator [Hyphomicrobiales bacterium]
MSTVKRVNRTTRRVPVPETSEAVTTAVRALYQRSGLSLDQFARTIGFARASSVQRYMSADDYRKRYLSRDLVDNMMPLVGLGEPPIEPADVLRLAGPEYVATVPSNAEVGGPYALTAPRIPVYGQAVGGSDGRFLMNGDTLDEVLAPPILSDVSGAYAVFVYGDSMEPRYYDGEVVYVDPRRRPRKGEFTVAQISGGDGGPPLAFVKRFVRWTDKVLVLEQFNPAEELTFP